MRQGGGEGKNAQYGAVATAPHRATPDRPPAPRAPAFARRGADDGHAGAGATHTRARPGALSTHPVAAGPVPFTRTHKRTRTKRSDHRRRFASARSSFPDHLFDRVRCRRRRRRRRSRHCHSRNSRGAVAVAVVSRARFRVLFPRAHNI